MTTQQEADQMKWDRRYRNMATVTEPCQLIRDNHYLLPSSGLALDVACGLGGNAIALAVQGLQVTAIDISAVAIEHLAAYVAKNALMIDAIQHDVLSMPLKDDYYDVVVVSHFLSRPLIPRLQNALKQNGLVFYQTFTCERVAGCGPRNPQYLLYPNELLEMFSGWRIFYYCEEGGLGDMDVAVAPGEAMLIAGKQQGSK